MFQGFLFRHRIKALHMRRRMKLVILKHFWTETEVRKQNNEKLILYQSRTHPQISFIDNIVAEKREFVEWWWSGIRCCVEWKKVLRPLPRSLASAERRQNKALPSELN